MQTQVDILILGAGPAGVSAALTLRNRNKTVLLCQAGEGALDKAHAILNYPGARGLSGRELGERMREEALLSGAELVKKSVTQVMPTGEGFSALVGDEIVSCKALLLAVGTPRKAGLPGEKEGVGVGVSYCATCDGMFYRGKTVLVLGAWEEAVEEAKFLASLAKEVLYIPEKPHEVSFTEENVRMIEEKPLEILLENGHVAGVRTDAGVHQADGVFVLRPSAPPDSLLPGLKIENGLIATDGAGRASLPHVYAAGDAASSFKQVAAAVGSGCVAALSIVKDLSEGDGQ